MGGLITKIFNRSSKNISINDYNLKIIKKIGEGGFADVYLVKANDNNSYALKHFNCLDDKDRKNVAETEIKYLKHFKGRSSCIIDIIDTDNKEYVLLPLFLKGSLQSIIDKERNIKNIEPYIPICGLFSKKQILQYSLDICEGLNIIHNENPPLAHRDISPGNILIRNNDDNRIVIMDFGSISLARVNTENYNNCLKLQDLASTTCSILYRAPELHEVITHSLIDERSDVWSLGCVMYFMLYGISPFEYAYKEGGSIKMATINASPTYYEEGYDEEIVQIIKSILITDVEQRPSILEIKNKIDEILLFDELDR